MTEVGMEETQAGSVVSVTIWLKRMEGLDPANARAEAGAADAMALRAADQVGLAMMAAASALMRDTWVGSVRFGWWCCIEWVENYQVLVNALELSEREGREQGRAGQEFDLHFDKLNRLLVHQNECLEKGRLCNERP